MDTSASVKRILNPIVAYLEGNQGKIGERQRADFISTLNNALTLIQSDDQTIALKGISELVKLLDAVRNAEGGLPDEKAIRAASPGDLLKLQNRVAKTVEKNFEFLFNLIALLRDRDFSEVAANRRLLLAYIEEKNDEKRKRYWADFITTLKSENVFVLCCLVEIVFDEMNHFYKLSDVHDIFEERLFSEKALRTASLFDLLKLWNRASKAGKKNLKLVKLTIEMVRFGSRLRDSLDSTKLGGLVFGNVSRKRN